MAAKRIEGDVTEVSFVTWSDGSAINVHLAARGSDEDLGWYYLETARAATVDGNDVTQAELVAFLHHGGETPNLPRAVLMMDDDSYVPCESAEFFSA